MLLFDYNRGISQTRKLLAKPFLFKIKEKFLGREGESFEKASMEIFKTTKYNYLSTSLPFIIEYPVILGLFFILYHPISILFPTLRSSLPALSEIAAGITTNRFSEINIIEAVRQNPKAFNEFNISGIANMKSSIFGIDVLHTAKMGDITMILPIITILYYLYIIVRLLIPVFKKQKKLQSVALQLALYIFIGASIAASSFSLPLVFYCYLVIFIIVSSITNRLINKFIIKTKKPWVIEQNAACQEILKKYGITEYVSALKDDTNKTTDENIKDSKEENEIISQENNN